MTRPLHALALACTALVLARAPAQSEPASGGGRWGGEGSTRAVAGERASPAAAWAPAREAPPIRALGFRPVGAAHTADPARSPAGTRASAATAREVEPRQEARPGPGARRASGQGPAPSPAPAAPAAPPQAPPPGARSLRNANYSIDATLDAARRLVTGRETITWRNVTSTPAAALRLHLYWNAWRNTRSTWLQERILAGTAGDLVRRPERDWAWTEVSTVRLLHAGTEPFVDLTSRKRYIAPDDGNADDRTLLEIALPAPVAPGETITLELEWQARVPRTFARTGAIGTFFFLAQWFPKVGVFADEGWQARQFHAGTEFFADYGVYDVRLRVPTGWVVGATGLEQSRRDNGDGTTTHRYVQEDVHDFAWTTSPDFIERRERFEHPGLPPVDMRLLLQPEHAGQADRHFAATRAALRYYGEWYGPYPYGHVTIVDPAWQSGAGGMEYPTLFTAGTRWWAPRAVTQPEGVTVHEAGHQFWYGLVGNNEFDHAWLDEGLNTFSTARTLEAAGFANHRAERFFGGFVPWVYRDIPLKRDTDGNGLNDYRPAAKSDAQATPSWRYWPATGGRITYQKTALWLHTLERHLGWTVLQRIMSTFFSRWAFRHPRPADFFAVANEVSGQDLTWFFDQVHRSSNVFDYGIQELRSERRRVRGFVDRDGGRVFSPGDAAGEDAGAPYETTVVVRRYGEAIFPVDLLVTFEDGETVRTRWDGRDRWTAFRWERPARARSAVVDPDRVLLLDIDYTNNSRTLEPRGRQAATKWALRWLVWAQDLLMTYAFFV
jgi:hypothetical protein